MTIDRPIMYILIAAVLAIIAGVYEFSRRKGHAEAFERGREIGQDEMMNSLWELAEKNPELAYSWNLATWRENPSDYASELAQHDEQIGNLISLTNSTDTYRREKLRDSARKRVRAINRQS